MTLEVDLQETHFPHRLQTVTFKQKMFLPRELDEDPPKTSKSERQSLAEPDRMASIYSDPSLF